jgi:hypothetical protein
MAAKRTPKKIPKTPETKKLSITDALIIEAGKRLSPSQKKRLADMFGYKYDPRITNPNFKGNIEDFYPKK